MTMLPDPIREALTAGHLAHRPSVRFLGAVFRRLPGSQAHARYASGR
jgi:hypothetical protein